MPPQTSVMSTKAPIMVLIFSWVLFLIGLFVLFESGFFFGVFFSFSSLSAIAYIVASFGMRTMKKWALYVISLFLILVIGMRLYYVMSPYGSAAQWFDWANIIITIIITLYLWSIHRQLN